MNRRRALAIITSTTIGAGVTFACRVSGESRQQQDKETTLSGDLTVYSGRSQFLVGPIIKKFGATTGIDVRVKYAGTPQLASTLLEEGSNSPADLFFGQEPGGLGAVEHMLAPLPKSLQSLVPEWGRSPQGRWVGITGRARTVVYNTDLLREIDLPDDLWGFTDPKWKGRIGWAPTNASFQTMVTAMRNLWGEGNTRKWLTGIQANKPQIYPKNSPIVAAVGVGEIEVGFVNHYYLHRFLSEEGPGFRARNYHPRAGGPGALILVAGIGVLGSSSKSETAERFIEYLLSPLAQNYFAEETFEYPLREGVEPSSSLVPLSSLQHPQIAVGDLADLEATQEVLRDLGILP